jgi:hypothetical protein
MTDDQLLRTSFLMAHGGPTTLRDEPTRALEVWRLRRGEHMLICELRDECIDVDVLSLDATRWPVVTQRCASQAHAEFVAMSYRRTYLRQGWAEQR